MDKNNNIFICVVFVASFGCVFAAPKMRVYPQVQKKLLVTENLPANWTQIRQDISDTFSCEGKSYGYYADVDNDCQLFHVCLPVEGRNYTFRWSFICPAETIFNQESFTCTRAEDSVRCEDAPDFYKLNDNFGQTEQEQENPENDENNENNENNDEQVVVNSIEGRTSSKEQTNKRRNNTR